MTPAPHPAIAYRRALRSTLANAGATTDDRLQPGALHVGFVLSEHANEDGQAWPSAARLAAQTGLSVRAVSSHLDNLVSKGFLVQLVQGGLAGGPKTSTYQLVCPPESDVLATLPRPKVVKANDATTSALVAEVTSANDDTTSALVAEVTSANDDTTSANDDTTSATSADELEELEELEKRERATVAAVRLVDRCPDEVPGILAELEQSHGLAPVVDAVDRLTLAEHRFGWPSELRKALRSELRPVKPVDPPRPSLAPVGSATRCPTCNGTGRDLPPGESVAVPCPRCHPGSAAPATAAAPARRLVVVPS